jgi:NarL family two-component system response regulator LiaR
MPDKQPDQDTIRILIADDHEIVREGLATILAAQPDLNVVGAAADGVAAVLLARQLRPDVILMDLAMPRQDGVAAIVAITRDVPEARILVLTSFADDERVFPAIKAGALGYLLKDTPRAQLFQAIRDVARGHVFLDTRIALKLMNELKRPSDLPHTTNPLTAREMETLRCIARGLSNQEIAAEMGIHERTVAKYVSVILDKLHLANRTQAALYAIQQKLTTMDS